MSTPDDEPLVERAKCGTRYENPDLGDRDINHGATCDREPHDSDEPHSGSNMRGWRVWWQDKQRP